MERKGWGSALTCTPLGASRGGRRLGRALAAPFPRLGRSSFEGDQRQANLSAIESQGGTMLGMLAIAGTGYGLIGLLVIILLIVLIVYFARRA